MENKKNRIKIPDLDKYVEGREKKYTTYAVGARLYSLNYYSFVRLAREAGANVKFRKNVLVDLGVLEDYMSKHTGGNKYE